MILFILEGKKREPSILNTIKHLFFKDKYKEDYFVTCYCSCVDSFYNKMVELNKLDDSADTVETLKELLPQDDALQSHTSSEFSEIYLFFDYDLSNKQFTSSHNAKVIELLNFFSNETDKGKLFLSYPMVEALLYIPKNLPDDEFFNYTVNSDITKEFKEMVLKKNSQSYKNNDNLLFKRKRGQDLNTSKLPDYVDDCYYQKILTNWKHINAQHIKKANYICCGLNEIPSNKDSISQRVIFENQISKFIERQAKLSILSAFPLFLFYYFKDPSYIL